ncbi:hypothetical protein [Amycolatopsis sp. NBC_01480]|uniref:hypothetical protein n=1 Tax=Amycolatopsis sp. NBC_01480 TaxID=2903562 RepID=UPI002E2B1D24|nr:hypothetical protein [Amycolatopsis sp. NBC_01480]
MTITATNHADLVPRIRQEFDEAQREGRRPPGRPALQKLTGATDHAIKTALQKINDEHITSDRNRQAPPAAGLTTATSRHIHPGDQTLAAASPHQNVGDLNHPAGAPAAEPSPGHQFASPPPGPATSTASAGVSPHHHAVEPGHSRTPAGARQGSAGSSTDTGDASSTSRTGASTPPAITSPAPAPLSVVGADHPPASANPPAGTSQPASPALIATATANAASSPADGASAGEPVTTGGGRVVAWAGFAFGSVMSIAANVLHTWLPPTNTPPDWTPGLAPQIGAAVWPIGLLLSVEILSRVRWPHTWHWNLARYGGAGTVTLGSALISYMHLHGLLLAWGYDTLGAAVGPLVLDGLMTISGFALLANSQTTTTSKPCRSLAEPSTNDQRR